MSFPVLTTRLRRSVARCAIATLAFGCLWTAGNLRADERPNFVVILSSDMGYSDIGCYGGEIATPNLDKLAQQGLRFTHFYNAGRSCPTRASLVSGLYPHQAGMGWTTEFSGPEGYQGELNHRCVTLAEVLGTAGYQTYMAGKWHLTPRPTPESVEADAVDRQNWPLSRGWDHFYGTIAGSGSYFDPATLVRDEQLIPPENASDYYYTDAISNNAAKYIRERDRQKPFFLYLAYPAAHWPLHAKQADLEKYAGKYDQGWDEVRGARLKRMHELGLVKENVGLAPNINDWKNAERKEWQAKRMEAYAAMVDSMDQGIGRVLQSLRETGAHDNTLVLYLQDSGASQAEFKSSEARQKREKLEPKEPIPADQIQLATVPEYTRDGKPVQWGRGVVPGPANTYMEVGREWANVSNTPFRLFKQFMHEGGIATPLIAHWPQGIKRKDEVESTPGHVVDFMPTLIELAGAEYPQQFHEEQQDIQSLEGVSLAPLFAGEPLKRAQPLFWEHEGNRAVRSGDWKLVARGEKGKWQLYNLAEDRSELNDLAEKHPQRVSELKGAWGAWAARANVYPLTPYIAKPADEGQKKSAENKGAAARASKVLR